MPAALFALAFLAGTALSAQVTREAPAYSAATIVNAASGSASALAPYTLIKIVGTNLAWDSKALQPTDIRESTVPTALPAMGVHVYVNNEGAGLLSVSPTQIIALIPGDLAAGPAVIRTALDGLSGPRVKVVLAAFAPGLFANDDGSLIVARENGDLVTADTPLNPGEICVLHAVGFGPGRPALQALEIPTSALALDVQTTVAVYLNDNPIDPALIQSVRLVAGQAGVYELRVQLPLDAPTNPEIRVEANGFKSPAGLTMALLGASGG